MSSRIVEFTARAGRNHEGAPGAPEPIRFPVITERRVHEWDVEAVTMLKIDAGAVPATAVVRWMIDVDPLRRRWEVAVVREGWDVPYVLQSAPTPGESPVQIAEREGALRLLNELLSLSFGVPA